jgi:hypothetical protein
LERDERRCFRECTRAAGRGNVAAVAVRGSWSVSLLLLLSLVAGCRDDLTQVVVVLQSDLVVPGDTDSIQTRVVDGPFAPDPGGFGAGFFGGGPLSTSGFPLSFGVQSGGQSSSFSFDVQLTKGFDSGQAPLIVVSRTITDVRFVDEKTMMLVVPLMRACACAGTSCPAPGNPLCDAIDRPTLDPFDPDVAPPSMPNGNGTFGPGRPATQSAETGGSAS